MAADRAAEVVVLGEGSALPSRPQADFTALPTAADLHLAFERELDLNRYPVLRAHVLDGRAVLPMALTVEWLAHAAPWQPRPHVPRRRRPENLSTGHRRGRSADECPGDGGSAGDRRRPLSRVGRGAAGRRRTAARSCSAAATCVNGRPASGHALAGRTGVAPVPARHRRRLPASAFPWPGTPRDRLDPRLRPGRDHRHGATRLRRRRRGCNSRSGALGSPTRSYSIARFRALSVWCHARRGAVIAAERARPVPPVPPVVPEGRGPHCRAGGGRVGPDRAGGRSNSSIRRECSSPASRNMNAFSTPH